ncbi:hypothetical protein [Kineosporia sp. NBRC 101731]|uniref:hypothetical protein n=1 Tax=Kineosporia sp. NBRC 101731 TaxID=3032199 RepID=UPI0025523F2B|nr:hypothetical protein [Kineosporia sp. NBRC 101731]
MSPGPSLPPQARHEAAARLVGLGLYREAQSLLSVDEPDDAVPGMLASILASDPRAGAKFLGRRMMASQARPGETELVRGCIAMVSGRAEGLQTARLGLERLEEPGPDDWTMFAVSAAPHDLTAAAEAASSITTAPNAAVLAVLAAARAAQGDAHGAHRLLDAAAWNGVGDDPRHRTADLLKSHGHESAGQELDAAHWHRRSLGESWARRMETWRRRRTERDLRCRCASTPVFVGEGTRYYVNWHLELLEHLEGDESDGSPSWRVLFCPRSGVRYLDRESIPASVRIGVFTEPLPMVDEEPPRAVGGQF